MSVRSSPARSRQVETPAIQAFIDQAKLAERVDDQQSHRALGHVPGNVDILFYYAERSALA